MCWYYQRFLLCHALKSLQFGAVTTSWFTTLYNARMHTLILVYTKRIKYFLFIKCTWKILGLWILSNTAFKIHIYSFENIIMSNINGWDTLKMECYERIIFLHIVTRFCWIKWNSYDVPTAVTTSLQSPKYGYHVVKSHLLRHPRFFPTQNWSLLVFNRSADRFISSTVRPCYEISIDISLIRSNRPVWESAGCRKSPFWT